MVIDQHKSKRSSSGARYHKARGRRLFELGKAPSLTKLGELRKKIDRMLGGKSKIRLLKAEYANLLDTKTNKFVKAKIKTIVDNAANRHYVRRNIMTKGTIIDTDKGKAKITNRPGQEGAINAVLIQ